MFSRFPKWLFRAFLAFVALELLYLLAVTIALNTGLVERIINPPEGNVVPLTVEG